MTKNNNQQPTDIPSHALNSLAEGQVVVGVCGGISAYKTAAMVSTLVQARCRVTVVMTEAATHFVTPLTFQTLTARQVFTSLWHAESYYDPQHLSLLDGCQAVVVAPATANMLAKVNAGIADDLLSTLLVAAQCPILFAPAMNTRMWNNRIVQRNVASLRDMGFHFVGPEQGWLACRDAGYGRMSDPADIITELTAAISDTGNRPE